ncbi:MAG: DUF423 domain-containing protein [Verrucomicrobiales bacterium]|nr:DUF423 domain-containing protein [Verrucomicrobiales bacterium]
MMKKGTAMARVGAGLMFLGVALGAFGAHGLEDLLQENDRLDTWQTAVFYQLIHAMAVWVLALLAPERSKVALCFALGVVVFSGSLYVLSLTNILWLGAITPLGGLLFLGGWAALLIRPHNKDS